MVTGGQAGEQRRFGDHLSHDARYARTAGAGARRVLRRLVGRGGQVAARHVDTYLTWGEPPAQVAGKLAWIGSHQQVADLIEEYASLGISEFILSGYPHLEEAYWFGEGVLPELRRRGR